MNPEYFNARFRVELTPALFPDEFAIVTACNPDGKTISTEENIRRSIAFKALLTERGFAYFPVTGFDPNSHHAEPGFGIVCDLETGFQLGLDQRQEAIFFVSGDRLRLISCSEFSSQSDLGSWRARVE